MLSHVTAEDFRALLNKPLALYLPDGSTLTIQIRSIRQSPSACLPGNPRMAFSVTLNSLEPTDFVDGLCRLPLSDSVCLEQVFVSREPAMGRDDGRGYFSIVFN